MIIDRIQQGEDIKAIETTLDQIKSFPRELIGNQIKTRIAIVSHAPHIARILRYFDEYKLFPETITDEVTAVMVLPVDTRRGPEVVLIDSFQYGLGRRTLEAPGARVKEGQTVDNTVNSVLRSWGISTLGTRPRGLRDETSGRQYNVNTTFEAEYEELSYHHDHVYKGEGKRMSIRTPISLGLAYDMAADGRISNSPTTNLIFQTARARGI